MDIITIREQKEIDMLKHLVREYPQEAMECLSYNQMLEYILSHNNVNVNLEDAKATVGARR